MKTKFFACLLCFATTSLHAAESRTWTNQDSRTVTGSFQDAVINAEGQPSAAKIRLATGQVVTVDLTTLSAEDREYVASAMEAKAAAEKLAKLANRRAKWHEDWEKAQNEAGETGLPILLLMTGSDWCGYCIQLKGQVFDSREFQKFADTNYVLMVADFPHATQAKALKAQNEKLKQQFPFGGYPTVMIIKDEKKVGHMSGYGGDSPKAYIENLVAQTR